MREERYGYCKCGCGQKTTIAKESKLSEGIVKGESMDFIHGHNRRSKDAPLPGEVNKDIIIRDAITDYFIADLTNKFCDLLIYNKDAAIRWIARTYLELTPNRKTEVKYKPTHMRAWRKRAEMALGKPLPKDAVVHHIDGDWGNQENNNLVICQDMKYHKLLHRRATSLKESGDARLLKCHMCKQYDRPEMIKVYERKDGSDHYYHPACHAAKERARRKRKKEALP